MRSHPPPTMSPLSLRHTLLRTWSLALLDALPPAYEGNYAV